MVRLHRARGAWLAGLLLAVLLTLQPGAAGHAAGGAVATAHPIATRVGETILAQGGNAFDAAVAVSAALGVVEPYASGIGGGGFLLLHRASDRFEVMVDAREVAPARSSADMYLGPDGRIVPNASTFGARAAAIPGLPAALVHVSRKYGRLPLATALAPAIRLARDGFPADGRYVMLTGLRLSGLRDGIRTADVFLDGGSVPAPGFIVRQPDLARTLEALVAGGADGFYRGPVAQALIAGVQAAGGIWELSDLADYRVIEREPTRIRFRGATITMASLPSSGGATLAQALQILDRLPRPPPGTPDHAHLVIEALRRGFEDRLRYLGDPDQSAIPVARLVDPGYARDRAAAIDPARATSVPKLPEPAPAGGSDTTHFSIVDRDGNRVGGTLSINTLFGACVIPAGTGVLLNNEMDDFTIHPDAGNSYRLRTGSANAIAPRRRPLSSMTPTFVEDSRGALVLGAPGGSRIISQVLLAVLDHLGRAEVDLVRTVSLPRYHHQFWPDEVEIEPTGFTADWIDALERKGHRVTRVRRQWGNMQAVFRDAGSGTARAASDPRGIGVAWY
jgi:gamma-glutamyltranspeptidase/glutathione hydrolase